VAFFGSNVGEASVSLSHFDVLVPEQFLLLEEASPAPDGHARERVAQVVDAEVLDCGKLADLLEVDSIAANRQNLFF